MIEEDDPRVMIPLMADYDDQQVGAPRVPVMAPYLDEISVMNNALADMGIDLLGYLLQYCDARDVLNLALANPNIYRRLSHNDAILRPIIERDFPDAVNTLHHLLEKLKNTLAYATEPEVHTRMVFTCCECFWLFVRIACTTSGLCLGAAGMVAIQSYLPLCGPAWLQTLETDCYMVSIIIPPTCGTTAGAFCLEDRVIGRAQRHNEAHFLITEENTPAAYAPGV